MSEELKACPIYTICDKHRNHPSVSEEKIEEMGRRLVDLLGELGDEDWPYEITDAELDELVCKRFTDELRKHIGEVK